MSRFSMNILMMNAWNSAREKLKTIAGGLFDSFTGTAKNVQATRIHSIWNFGFSFHLVNFISVETTVWEN